MSPRLGQGVNLALLDAMVLADSIGRETTLPAALAACTAARRPNVSFYQYASRWLLPLFQSDLVFLGPLRDLCVRPIASIPFLRRHMLHAMAGTKTGWWTMMDLPEFPPT